MTSGTTKFKATLFTALIVIVAGAAILHASNVSIVGTPLPSENREALKRELERNAPANVRLVVVIEDHVVHETKIADATPRAVQTR
ncbi:MAG TPA: hypothetical protein VMU84_16510 [Thermoanaerobaculia bacterium]|nr:hypothetical protein [Thermoanaerobaculia bacterium]